MPIYEKEISEGKGPQLFTLSGNLIALDLFAFKDGAQTAQWIEAKHKSAFSWHRITRQWVTGIDLRHYEDYLQMQERSPWLIWLLFLQRNGMAKDTPAGMISPIGLYGGSIPFLKEHEHHRHANWGKTGMVYWDEQTLTRVAELDEVIK